MQTPNNTPQIDISKLAPEVQAMILSLQASLAAKQSSGSMKVSEKGAVSVYGLGKLPVTLYKSQWEALFLRIDDLKKFLIDNDARLAVKQQAPKKA